jgi:hypothetical protein
MFFFMWINYSFNDLTPGYIAIPDVGLGFGPIVAGKFMGVVQTGMILGSIACGFIMEKLLKWQDKASCADRFFISIDFYAFC